jgi:hypothetical protein
MKQLLSFCALLLVAGAFLVGCDQDPNASGPDIRPMAAKGTSSITNPALVWTGAIQGDGQQSDAASYYSAIWVADSSFSTGTHLVLKAKANRYSMYFNGVPGWSPSGGSVCLVQKGINTMPDSIKAFDISVSTKKGNSYGDPVGSNERTLIGFANTNSRIRNAFWSSTSTMNKLAYTTINGTTESLWVISGSGGTPTNIWTVDNLTLESPTWNADDSRLAVVRNNASGGTATIMIFNTSTGAYVDSISVSGAIKGLEWSRSGMNKLAFGLNASGSDKLYYCDPTTGATPATNNVAGVNPTWSPNNSSTMYMNTSGLNKNVPFTTSTTSVLTFGGFGVKWKR